MQKPNYIQSITGIRAILMLLVLFFHLYIFVFKFAYDVPYFLKQIFTHFWIAVDMFFILSGYVISLNYYYPLKNKQISYRSYLVSRIARIFPAHVFIMVATLLFILLYYGTDFWLSESKNWRTITAFRSSHSSWDITEFFKTLFLVQSWGIPTRMGWNTVAWSVSCEWLAYLTFPIFIAVSSWFSKHRWLLITTAALLFFTGLFVMGLSVKAHGVNHVGVVRLIFDFYIGIVLFLLTCNTSISQREIKRSAALYLFSLIIAIAAFSSFYYFMSFVWLIPAFAVLLYLLITNKIPTLILSNKITVYLGNISYSFYLLHGILLVLWHALFPLQALIEKGQFYVALFIASYVLACLLGSIVVYHFIEEPSRRKIRKLFS